MVASTNVYGDIVERIGADRVDVVSIISDPAQDPHSYEASTRAQLELAKAKVVVENGGGYDDFVDRMLRSSGNSPADVINVVTLAGKTVPAGGELNEHVWYDFPTMGRLADRIAAALARVEPADAGTFREHAKEFKDELASLQARTDRIKADHAGTPVAVTEPVPLYLTEGPPPRGGDPGFRRSPALRGRARRHAVGWRTAACPHRAGPGYRPADPAV